MMQEPTEDGCLILFVHQAQGVYAPYLIEQASPTNVLSAQNYPAAFLPRMKDVFDVVDTHLLFRHVTPEAWYVPGIEELAGLDRSASVLWKPALPLPDAEPQVTFYPLGVYQNNQANVWVLAIECRDTEVRFKNPHWRILKATTQPTFTELSPDMAHFMGDAWPQFFPSL